MDSWNNRPARVTRRLPGWRQSCAGQSVARLMSGGRPVPTAATTPWTDVRASVAPPRELAKWCAGALVLVLPGSFVVLALLWLYRRWS
jgi:hypothetical protein